VLFCFLRAGLGGEAERGGGGDRVSMAAAAIKSVAPSFPLPEATLRRREGKHEGKMRERKG